MKNELLFKQNEMKKNKHKKYWKGSFLNLGDDKNNDWIDCDKIQRYKFDQSDLGDNYYIEIWMSCGYQTITNLTEEDHNDIRFEILNYLDKL